MPKNYALATSAFSTELSAKVIELPLPPTLAELVKYSLGLDDDVERDKSDSSSIAFCFLRTFQ